jgi:type I restriction enzyme S subunit
MSFPRYPKYKDSGVEWLGQVPEHWDVCPIKRRIVKLESGTSVNASDEPAINGKPGVLKTSCVYSGIFKPEENKTVDEDEFNRVSCPLKLGTLIVSRMNTPDLIGSAGLVTTAPPNLFLPDRLWQITFSNVDARFVHFWTLTSSYRSQVEAVCTGTSSSMKNLGQDQFGIFRFAAPPLAEQTQIAAFLDRETLKIDELVAEQRRLIELLKEKRQAVISHAVTKGLNPNAPMKPSGVEWLGAIPAHWELVPVWLLFEMGRGRVLSHGEIAENSGEYPVFSSQTDSDGVMGRIATYDFEGDYLTWTTDGANAGTVFRRSGKFSCTNVCGTLKARSGDLCLGYCHHALAISTPSYIRHDINPKLMNNVMAKIRIPVPPGTEQQRIAEFITESTATFDALIADSQRAIELLQERRAALISTAVTGGIDIRGLVDSKKAA